MNLLKKLCLTGACFTAFVLAGCGSGDDFVVVTPAVAQGAGFLTYSSSGTANVNQSIADFQATVGGVDNANASGSQATGFRSVNWDAPIVPVFPNAFPPDFFNNIANFPPTRGLVVGAVGNGLNASDDDFASLNADYADEFNAFSGTKTFSPTSTNVLYARFEVPNATGVPGSHVGFGAVFSDVDTAGSTTIEFFNGNTSLGSFEAPVRSDANGHSFLGVIWTNTNRVTSAKITLGNGTLGASVQDISDGGTADLVIVDDFFYGEPRVVGSL
jgi:hypothetical protein